jgi:vitamin B12/bleomycin/antimicrobial peptide transport system ATP-binding/permease protein
MRGLGPFLRDAWRLALPYFRSEERWPARALLASIIALNLTTVGINVILSFWNRAFYNSLQDKDWDSFISLLLLYKRTPDGSIMPGFCLVAALYVTVAVFRIYLNQWLRIRWRRWLTERFLGEWLGGQAYWRISLTAGSADGYGTDNPDQRIADDLNEFTTETLSLSLGLLSSVVSLFSFVAILWGLSGPLTLLGFTIPGYMVWLALVYAAIGTALTHLIGRPLAALNFRQQRVEADFRFSLARLRENMEGIALLGGEAVEKQALSARFAAVMANWWQIMHRTKLLTSVTAGYGQISVIFPIIIAAPRYFAGQIPLGALTQTSSAFGHVEGSLSWFVNAYASLAGWRATVERLAAFDRAIGAARAMTSGVRLDDGRSDAYELDEVNVALPDGQELLEIRNLSLAKGEPLTIVGRSGLGKSTLFRAIAGIWPFGSGQVRRPQSATRMFLPQRPYIPLGTLRHALTYPSPASAHEDETIRTALREVGLGNFEPRLDVEEPWTQRLSGGEQQRLAFARALLAKPDWLFLDEATSNLDLEAEAELHALLKRRLPATTTVSISHRPAAWQPRRLVFARGNSGPARLVEEPAAA